MIEDDTLMSQHFPLLFSYYIYAHDPYGVAFEKAEMEWRYPGARRQGVAILETPCM